MARATAFALHGSAAGERIAAHGLAAAGIAGTAVVSGFSAIGEEISPLPLLVRLRRDGHGLCLPVIVGKQLPLVFRSWAPGDPTAGGVWGIREPMPQAPTLDPDVLLVPLLAFDDQGNRLGYGGGFYDRTISRLRQLKPVLTIGIAFDEQRIDAVPYGVDDQRLDCVLTPSGLRRCVESG